MNTKKHSSHRNHYILFAALLAFWLILSPKITIESVIVGVIGALAVTWYNRHLTMSEDELSLDSFTTIGCVLTYLRHLLVAIVKSNIEVAKIVLSPKMPISPVFVKVPVHAKKDFFKVLYGNSITLTPGTLTVDIDETSYLVHALTVSSADDLQGSVIEQCVLSIEGGDK
jgi:multicomponent Na+:H+ antiporter subunit E